MWVVKDNFSSVKRLMWWGDTCYTGEVKTTFISATLSGWQASSLVFQRKISLCYQVWCRGELLDHFTLTSHIALFFLCIYLLYYLQYLILYCIDKLLSTYQCLWVSFLWNKCSICIYSRPAVIYIVEMKRRNDTTALIDTIEIVKYFYLRTQL